MLTSQAHHGSSYGMTAHTAVQQHTNDNAPTAWNSLPSNPLHLPFDLVLSEHQLASPTGSGFTESSSGASGASGVTNAYQSAPKSAANECADGSEKDKSKPKVKRRDSESNGSRSRSRVRAPVPGRSYSGNAPTLASADGKAPTQHDAVGKAPPTRSRPARRASIGPAAAAHMRETFVASNATGNEEGLVSPRSGAIDIQSRNRSKTSQYPANHFTSCSVPATASDWSFWPPNESMWPAHSQAGMPMYPAVSMPHQSAYTVPTQQHSGLMSSSLPAISGVAEGMQGLCVGPKEWSQQPYGMAGVFDGAVDKPTTPSDECVIVSPPAEMSGSDNQVRRGARPVPTSSTTARWRVLEDVPEAEVPPLPLSKSMPKSIDSQDAIQDQTAEPADGDEAMDEEEDISPVRGRGVRRRTEGERKQRRRESHNLVERRRRDTINERIAELATLLPEAMLLDAIANSQSGGNNSKVVKLPMPEALRPKGSTLGDEDDGSPSSATTLQEATLQSLASADPDSETLAAAQARPNKGIILRKSVDYIRALKDLIECQATHNRALLEELAQAKSQLSAKTAVDSNDHGAADSASPKEHRLWPDAGNSGCLAWPLHLTASHLQHGTFGGSSDTTSNGQQHRQWPDDHSEHNRFQPSGGVEKLTALSGMSPSSHVPPSLGEWLAIHPEYNSHCAKVDNASTATSGTSRDHAERLNSSEKGQQQAGPVEIKVEEE